MSNLIKKLLYRSNHRGTKEMDLLIGGFAIENLKKLNPEELKEFELLLNFTDKPFIFNLGHGILPQTPISNVELLLKIIQNKS